MGDSEVLYDVQRTLGFVKRNIDALSRKVGDRQQKSPAEKLRQTVVRAAAAALVTSQNGMDASAAHKRFMIEHGHAEAFKTGGGFVKAVTDPAMTTLAGWAQELAETEMLAPFAAATPNGLFAQLSRLPGVLTINATGPVSVPGFTSASSLNGSFVGEGQAIPFRQGETTGNTLTPGKFGVISGFSKELLKRTDGQIQTVVGAQMDADSARILDPILLGTDPASGSQPAGLLSGVTGLSPSSKDGAAAVAEDIAALIGSLSPALSVVILSRPEQRASATILSPGAAAVPWITSPWLPDNRVIALDVGKLVLSEADFSLDTTGEALVVTDDAPTALVAADGTVAAPQVSFFQQVYVGIRLIVMLGWAVRGDGLAASFVDGVGW